MSCSNPLKWRVVQREVGEVVTHTVTSVSELQRWRTRKDAWLYSRSLSEVRRDRLQGVCSCAMDVHILERRTQRHQIRTNTLPVSLKVLNLHVTKRRNYRNGARCEHVLTDKKLWTYYDPPLDVLSKVSIFLFVYTMFLALTNIIIISNKAIYTF